MRRTLTALVVAGALAGLFVSASRAPRLTAHRVVAKRFLVVIGINSTGCSTSALTATITCRSHAGAEKLRARFAKQHVPAVLSGRTVSIPSVYP